VPDAMKALAHGACEYLPKPLDAEDLTAHLQQIAERRAKRTEARAEAEAQAEASAKAAVATTTETKSKM
jgi:DNA-binding NtrC family response regulator